MIILKRQVVTEKTAEEVMRILKSSAYYFPEGVFEKSSFSMHCSKHRNGSLIPLIPVSGTVLECEGVTEVLINIHANLNIFLGAVAVSASIIGGICCLLSHTNRWFPCLGAVLLGLLFIGQALWEGSELLDLLEHKVTRKLGDSPAD